MCGMEACLLTYPITNPDPSDFNPLKTDTEGGNSSESEDRKG
ncbi:MAG: hypothetical protein V1872_10560 [bacterium]